MQFIRSGNQERSYNELQRFPVEPSESTKNCIKDAIPTLMPEASQSKTILQPENRLICSSSPVPIPLLLWSELLDPNHSGKRANA